MPTQTASTADSTAPGRTAPHRRGLTALRRTPVSLWNDDVTDWAAALTYYAILALLPALLVTVSVIGLANPDATGALIADITAFAPAESGEALRRPLEAATGQRSAVWLLVATGSVSAVWSACSYLAVFRRAMHAMHGVRDTRPPLRQAHIIVVSAIGLLLLLLTSAFALVMTGPLARWLGRRIGLPHEGESLWAVMKWPLLMFLVACLIMVLFSTGPRSARGVRRSLPGGVLAAFCWLAASALFALYATRVGSYSRLYGSLAGLVVFLIWVWFANLSLLAGAQFNVELRRERPERATGQGPGATAGPAAEGGPDAGEQKSLAGEERPVTAAE
ncbi:YihY/virulence factor BrkB family protein [Streptomyces sp. NPDC087897]|uniref:YihY/virulence factor BrkB family protein n=1 Tax=Streptomyces sp. NPDC087897 TaxID=3365817 RepID=UPI0038251A3E